MRRAAAQEDQSGAGDPSIPAALLTTIGSRQPFPPLVPADFSQRWFEALQAAYGASIPTGVTAGSLNGAYAMTWMMLWFQTSGAVLGLLGCRPKEPQPPGNCGKDKAELDPFKKKPDGTPAGPPPANIDEDFDEAAYICAIIMSILGFLPTPSGVIWDIISDEVKTGAVDWDNVRCKVYWIAEYLHNAVAGLKKLVALTGFGYPDPQVLHEDKQVSDVMGGATPLESARSLAKSRVRSEFPSKRGSPSLPTNWTRSTTAPTPSRRQWRSAESKTSSTRIPTPANQGSKKADDTYPHCRVSIVFHGRPGESAHQRRPHHPTR